MCWLDWMTKNTAELSPGADDPALRPVRVALPPDRAAAWAVGVLGRRPRWSIVSVDEAAGLVHATRRSRVFRFVDDVHLRFEPDGDGSVMAGRSGSRIGRGDLGQNARNLRDLARALAEARPSPESSAGGRPGDVSGQFLRKP